MRLFGKVDGVIDRFDRAEWLSPPFDGAWGEGTAPSRVARFVKIAAAVASELNGTSFAMPFTAMRAYRPVFSLPELETLRVTVMPREYKGTPQTRGKDQYDYQIDVAVQKKIDLDTVKEGDALMALVEEIQTHFRGGRLAAYEGAAWVKAANDPAYVPEHIDQRKVFTSVATLTYRVLG